MKEVTLEYKTNIPPSFYRNVVDVQYGNVKDGWLVLTFEDGSSEAIICSNVVRVIEGEEL